MSFQDVISYANDNLKHYDGSHDIWHAKKVAINVCHVCDNEKNLSIIAACLHDTCDPKYVNKSKAIPKLESFLLNILEKEEVDDILNAIENVSFSKLKINGVPSFKTNRSKIIWRNVSDSDMLEALGIIGIIRTLMYQGYKEHNIDEAFSYITTLYKCNDYIELKSAKKEGTIRKKYMMKYMKMLQKSDNLMEISTNIMNEGALKTSFDDVLKKYTKYLSKYKWIINELKRELKFGFM